MVVGDKVMIAKNSQYYNRCTPDNPRNIIGVIIEIGDFIIRVIWDNGEYNTYSKKDLVLIKNNIYELW
jgi:hypothetical protein